MRLVPSLALLLAATSAHAQRPWQLRDAQGNPIPTGLSAATQDDFGVQQIATTDGPALQRAWAQPTPGAQISTQQSATRNEKIVNFMIFRGCKADMDGHCHVTARFEIFDPAGKPFGTPAGGAVWGGLPPAPGNMQLSDSGYSLRVEDGQPLGKYRVVARTTDKVAGISLATEAILTIGEAPRVGGWSAVAAPDDDAGVRAAAAAMVKRLPVEHAKLKQIGTAQRQVVAGTNYRLVLILTDGSKWDALVWHKLDGSFVVSDPAQVR
ncbi:MAG: hypothetical protein JWM65_2546, partial [Sphingomonas bacterium]|nr:hypothetical protein [Sphingomonas bacterium]